MSQGKPRSQRGQVGLDTVGGTLAFTLSEMEGPEHRSDEVRPASLQAAGLHGGTVGWEWEALFEPRERRGGVRRVEQCTWEM